MEKGLVNHKLGESWKAYLERRIPGWESMQEG
jgi:hypothetical protein